MNLNLEMTVKQCRLNNIVNKISESRMMKDREYDPSLLRNIAFGEHANYLKPLEDEDFEMKTALYSDLNKNTEMTYHDMDSNRPQNIAQGPLVYEDQEMEPHKQEIESLKQDMAAKEPPTEAAEETWPNDLKMEELHIQKPQEKPYKSRAYCHVCY